MVKRLFSFSALFILLFILINCQQDGASSASNFSGNTPDDASLLLVSDEDPTGLESGADPAFMLDNRGMMYFFVLDLSDEQKEAIIEIHEKYKPDFKPFHQEWDIREADWTHIKAERDSIQALIYSEIVSILNEDQKVLLDQIQTQLENGEYPAMLVEYRVAKLTETLDLTEEQQEQISVLISAYGSQMLLARDSSDNRMDFENSRRQLGAELNEKIIALLTDEQVVIYNDILKDCARPRPGGPPSQRGHKGF